MNNEYPSESCGSICKNKNQYILNDAMLEITQMGESVMLKNGMFQNYLWINGPINHSHFLRRLNK